MTVQCQPSKAAIYLARAVESTVDSAARMRHSDEEWAAAAVDSVSCPVGSDPRLPVSSCWKFCQTSVAAQGTAPATHAASDIGALTNGGRSLFAFRLQHANAKSISAALRSVYANDALGQAEIREKVSGDDEAGTVLIYATPDEWKQVLPVLQKLDRTARMLRILVTVLEIWSEQAQSLMAALRPLSQEEIARMSSVQQGAQAPQNWIPLGAEISEQHGLGAAVLRGDELAIINSLQKSGSATVLSSFIVAVSSSNAAILRSGELIPYIEERRKFGSGGVETHGGYMATGSHLKIVPLIADDGASIVNVEYDLSSPLGSAGGTSAPVLSTRGIRTEVALKVGETAIIAGLLGNERGRDQSAGLQGNGGRWARNGQWKGGSSTERGEILVLLTPLVADPN
ncbi:secretin N-terminal domain-containing protein [Stenotrophomonas sp. RS-48]|uniref:type II secretion system protein GspD n=1 Tax=Stenotrophomonas sp. RS-48 TaxID=3043300 RepID=UPI0024B55D53|nr:secretin N-terminal domain-containing protein [Stenotrophomonas sp. RS-48]MDI9248316.1 secretin N-terminal domain-containing protein [Stenotrophomonas sp. RS-48]